MKRAVLIFTCFVGAAFGQLSVSWTPNPCVINTVNSGGPGWACVVHVTGSGSWTATEDGNYGPSARVCQIQTDHSCTGSTASGTGPAELRIYLSWDTAGLANGSYARTVTVAGVAIPVTETIAGYLPNPVYTNYKRLTQAQLVAAGCSSDWGVPQLSTFADACPSVGVQPGGTFWLPAVGGTTADPNFGTPLTTLAVDYHGYSTYLYTSAGGNYADTVDYTVATPENPNYPAGTQLWPSTSINAFGCGGQTYYPNLTLLKKFGMPEASWICLNQTTKSVHLIEGGTPPTISDLGPIFTLPDGQLCINNSTNVTVDGYTLVFGLLSSSACADYGTAAQWKALYLLNIFPPYNTIRIDLTDPRFANMPGQTRRWWMTEFDRDGYTYITPGTGEVVALWFIKVNKYTGQWTVQGSIPSPQNYNPGLIASDCTTYFYGCIPQGHDVEWQANGTVGVAFQSGLAYLPQSILFYQPTLGAQWSATQVELGGSVSWLYGPLDHHTAARNAAYGDPLPLIASATEYTGPSGGTYFDAMSITSVSGNTITLQQGDTGLSTSLGVTPGQQVLVGCANDNWGTGQDLEGVWTVSAVTVGPPYQLQLTGLNYAGTYPSSNPCAAIANVNSVQTNLSATVYLMRLDPLGFTLQMAQLAKNRNISYGCCLPGGATNYWTQAHTQLTQDGKYVIWATNNGEPNRMRLVAAQSPWQMLAEWNYELAPGYPVDMTPAGSGVVNIRARVPDSVSLGCTFSTTIDLGTSPLSVTMGGPYLERTGAFSGTSRTPYYWQCTSADNAYTARGTITPL